MNRLIILIFSLICLVACNNSVTIDDYKDEFEGVLEYSIEVKCKGYFTRKGIQNYLGHKMPTKEY